LNLHKDGIRSAFHYGPEQFLAVLWRILNLRVLQGGGFQFFNTQKQLVQFCEEMLSVFLLNLHACPHSSCAA
jgi:hypothetical protein